MKYFIFITLLSILTQFTGAQTWTDENNVWTYCHVGYNSWNENYPMCELSFTKFFFNGEQIVEGKKYKELWYQQILYNNTLIGTPDTWRLTTGTVTTESVYFIGVREDNGRIYVNAEEYCKQTGMNEYKIKDLLDNGIIKQLENEYILYDFNETLPTGVIPYIGNIYDLFFRFMDMPTDGIIRKDFLNLFFRKGEKQYQSPDFISDPFFSAQQYRPLAQEGKVWNFKMREYLRDSTLDHYYSYTVKSDTTINEKAYKKLYMQYDKYNIYTAALRDEGCRAYIVPANTESEFYYYDLELKERVQLTHGLDARPYKSPFTKDINGITLNCLEWLIGPTSVHMLFLWIEGIGCTQDFFKCHLFGPSDGGTVLGGYGELVSCIEDGVYLYGNATSVPTITRTAIPLHYERKDGYEGDTSNIWLETDGTNITFFLHEVKDVFTLYLNNEPLQIDFTGDMFKSFVPSTLLVNYRLESANEVFSVDIDQSLITGVPTPIVNGKLFNCRCYDLSGRHLTAPPTKGIYIRDGKKVILK